LKEIPGLESPSSMKHVMSYVLFCKNPTISLIWRLKKLWSLIFAFFFYSTEKKVDDSSKKVVCSCSIMWRQFVSWRCFHQSLVNHRKPSAWSKSFYFQHPCVKYVYKQLYIYRKVWVNGVTSEDDVILFITTSKRIENNVTIDCYHYAWRFHFAFSFTCLITCIFFFYHMQLIVRKYYCCNLSVVEKD